MSTSTDQQAPVPQVPGLTQQELDARTRAMAWGPVRPTTQDRPRKVWREQVLVRANELAGLATWMSTRSDASSDPLLRAANEDLDVAAQDHLKVARDAALGSTLWPPSSPRARVERAFGHLDAAEAALLRRAPDDVLRGRLPALVAYTRAHLPPAHPLRVRVAEVAEHYLAPLGEPHRGAPLDQPIAGVDRDTLVDASLTAAWAARREHIRLRSFRTVVWVATTCLLVLAVGLAVLALANPRWVPLCFAPQGAGTVVCPTATVAAPAGASGAAIADLVSGTARGVDATVVMLVGLAGAAITGAAAIRSMRGTSTPFAVPVALLALKLPTGALTAFLGLVLLHGEFVPGLSALDTSGQILAWALAFGAAQQLVTGLVDKKAQSVLDSVGSAPMATDRE